MDKDTKRDLSLATKELGNTKPLIIGALRHRVRPEEKFELVRSWRRIKEAQEAIQACL